jgi:hypothetical protein
MQDIKDIEAALEEFEDGWGELGYTNNEEVEGVDGLISGVENVGGMGKGEYRHVVLKIEHEGNVRHFKKVGCHVSHYGTTWDGPFTEVSPVQKTITVWE